MVNLPIRFDQIVFHIFFMFFHFPTCFFPSELRKWNSSLRIFPTDFPTYQNNIGDFPQLFQFPNMSHTISVWYISLHLPWISNQMISKYTIDGWYGCVCLSKLRFGTPCSTLFLFLWERKTEQQLLMVRWRRLVLGWWCLNTNVSLVITCCSDAGPWVFCGFLWRNIGEISQLIVGEIYVNSHRCPFFTGFTELRYLKWYRISSESVYIYGYYFTK